MQMEDLWISLRTGNVPGSIGLLQTWLSAACPGEAELLMRSAPRDIREHLSVLMLDLVTDWPKTILGVPVQLFVARSQDTPLRQRHFRLPQSPTCIVPIRGLVFMGWISEHSKLPMFPGSPKPIYIGMECMVCRIGLFRAQPDFDFDNQAIPARWWADLFTGCQADVYLSAHFLQPFPMACEIGQVLDDAARGKVWPEDEYLFIKELEAKWARQTGPIFHREGEIHIPNFGIQASWTEPGDDDI
jgi:hypothetical protein